MTAADIHCLYLVEFQNIEKLECSLQLVHCLFTELNISYNGKFLTMKAKNSLKYYSKY